MLVLCLMLSVTYYAKNYAGIIGWSLLATTPDSYEPAIHQVKSVLQINTVPLSATSFGCPDIAMASSELGHEHYNLSGHNSTTNYIPRDWLGIGLLTAKTRGRGTCVPSFLYTYVLLCFYIGFASCDM